MFAQLAGERRVRFGDVAVLAGGAADVLDEVLVAGVFDRVAEVGRVVQRRMERQGEGKEEGEEAAGHACSMWASMVTGQFNVLAM